jgi:MFS family permease
VGGQADLRRTAPWVLCAISLCLLGLASVLPWLVAGPVAGDQVGRLEGAIDALGFVGIPVVGALIASRLPTNPYGWLWCGTGLAAGLAEVGGPLIAVLDGPPWMAWLLEGWGFVSLIGLLVFVFLLFPTGRLPTHRWRWFARAAATVTLLLILVVPFIYDEGDPAAAGPWAVQGEGGRYLRQAAEVGVSAMLGSVLLAMFSLVLRFRRAAPVERRQLTWFLYATVVNALILVLDAALGVLPALVSAVVSALGFILLPAAVGVAMLRYRLFEIDRIVSRTVSYGLLTGGLVGLYLLVVALLRPLLEPLTGSSSLAVAGSTLAVAAVFNPARRRLQAAVDRRFDRARYDAARAVDAFAARLRNQVDLDEVTAGLRDTVVATVAPTRVAVWLRVPSRSEI